MRKRAIFAFLPCIFLPHWSLGASLDTLPDNDSLAVAHVRQLVHDRQLLDAIRESKAIGNDNKFYNPIEISALIWAKADSFCWPEYEREDISEPMSVLDSAYQFMISGVMSYDDFQKKGYGEFIAVDVFAEMLYHYALFVKKATPKHRWSIEVLNTVAELNPDKVEVYLALGDAYWISVQKEPARENYELYYRKMIARGAKKKEIPDRVRSRCHKCN